MSSSSRNNLLSGKIKKRFDTLAANSEGIEMSEVWKTKYGPRRVRRDPPTLAEAVAAARGLTDDVQEQIEIAASLMDLPPDQVKPEVLKAATSRKEANTVAFVGRPGAPRTVVVERVPSRRPMAAKLIASKGLTGKRIGR
jgi:hypothetical protein